jgi:sorting nexin-9/18/33
MQVLLRLCTVRRTFELPVYPHLASGGTCKPSIYKRDLEHLRLNLDPLPQPCLHMWDMMPMQPVSHTIQEGIRLLLGTAANAVSGWGSVFGQFW